MAERPTCPRCGSELPARAPRGLCPRCLLREGLDGEALSLASGGVPAATASLAAGPDGASVLEALAATVGPVPRVLLRDTDPAEAPAPLVRPGSDAMPAPSDHSARLRLLGEIARGGMGAVLKGRDEDLGRDLAVKILLERHRDNPELIRRFVEEARIAGQLQHPGIAPIYELGAFADRRPYFTMKLIKGRTLADLLRERAEPARDLPRLLGIFEAVCQTVAYAHARKVIHRDLKPSNVMVGGFGEVQVMDWGLAKVLPRGGASDDATAGRVEPRETIVTTARGDSDSDLSRAGSVLGTPSYMAPEQARGEVDRVDERADVFALGSILCELLTGSRAFTGRDSGEIQRKAARAETADALARLDACGADVELVALARDCLAAEPEGRPHDAGAVARRVSAHLAGVQEKLRAAEIDRARAEARAAEERRRRKLQLGLAASLMALTILGGLALTYELNRRQAAAARSDRLLAEATALLDQAQQHREQTTRWREALAAMQQIEDAWGANHGGHARARLLALRDDAQAGLRDAERDEELLRKLAEIRVLGGFRHAALSDEAYARAFREAGLDLDAASVTEAADLLRRRPEPVVRELVAYLDHWATSRQWLTEPWRKLLQVARAIDPDPHRDKVRALLLADRAERDMADRRQALQEIAADPRASEFTGSTAVPLGYALAWAGDMPGEAALLERVVARHPDDVWANAILGLVLQMLGRPEDAARYYSAARALRPEAGVLLAILLPELDRHDEAEQIDADVVRRMPDQLYVLQEYGKFLLDRGRTREAVPILDRAVAAYRAEIARLHSVLMLRQGLLMLLTRLGRYDEAVNLCREAAGATPEGYQLYCNLAIYMAQEGRVDEAMAMYRKWTQTGPGYPLGHHEFGAALGRQGRREEAIAAYREAIRLDPEYALARCSLGLSLQQTGDFTGALGELRLGHELGSKRPNWRFPSADWLRQAEQFAAVADRPPAILSGDDQPTDNAERLAFARMCYDTKRHAAAARLWAEALEDDPKLADDLEAAHRYNAACACAGALAGCGKGQDNPPPDDAARTELRGRALEWLRADLASRADQLQADAAEARRASAHWKRDSDLAGVRDPDALAALPEEERADWQALWAEVDRLLQKTGETH